MNTRRAAARIPAAAGTTAAEPLLRLSSEKIIKAARYADPDGRPIYASSIVPKAFEQKALAFVRKYCASIQPKKC